MLGMHIPLAGGAHPGGALPVGGEGQGTVKPGTLTYIYIVHIYIYIYIYVQHVCLAIERETPIVKLLYI